MIAVRERGEAGMRAERLISVIGGFVVLVFALKLIMPGAETGSGAGTAVDKLKDAALIEAAVDRLPRRADWQNVEIKHAEGREYSATVWYSQQDSVMQGQPGADARAVVRAILEALVHAGRRPADERVNVFVSAMQRVQGETGKPLVSWFGNASYDYNTDSISYEACTGKGWFGC